MNLKSLNIAEWFSFSRIITFPIVILLVWIEQRQFTAWFYAIMFSTDFIDGFFAYFYNMDGKRRAQLDTLGDILYILAGLFGFFIFEKVFFVENFYWIGIVAVLYFIQLTISLVRFGKPSLFHTFLAKIATVFQVVFIVHMFFFAPNTLIFYLAIGLSILEAIEELVMILLIKEGRENVKGIWDLKNSHEGT